MPQQTSDNKLNIDVKFTSNEQLSKKQLQTLFDIKKSQREDNFIGMHVAKLLCNKLEGSLTLKQESNKVVRFSIQVGYKLDLTKKISSHFSSTAVGDVMVSGISGMVELS